MHAFEPTSYGPFFAEWLAINRARPLDAGTPDRKLQPRLSALTVEQAFEGKSIRNRTMAECCISGVWLLYDFLDESHSISQRIKTSEGSFWHGIMHRREGDFSNAKYWFGQVGTHPIFPELATEAASVPLLDGSKGWDPYEFVDQCAAAVRGTSEATNNLREVQQIEFELLFDHCYQNAI